MLKNVLNQIKSIVALNSYAALDALNRVELYDLQDAGDNVLIYAKDRDIHNENAQRILDAAKRRGQEELTPKEEQQYLDEIKLSQDCELNRRKNLREMKYGAKENRRIAYEADLGKEYEYLYGIPKEPPKWKVQKVKVAPAIPDTMVYVNQNKLNKLATTKPAIRAMNIYRNNLQKYGATDPEKATEELVKAVEREFSKLSIEQRQLLAANLKFKVDQKLGA